MADTEKASPKTTPKGGRNGGTLFPKLNLKHALGYAQKLVSKTHTGAQPEKIVLPGVFGSAGPTGKVRASALKQYGLLEGTAQAYKATNLTRDIDAAPEDDRSPLVQQALLNSKLFRDIFETFRGDTISKVKIEQRAKGLNVHPESAAECAQLFMDSAVTAAIGTVSGDSISLVNVGPITPATDGSRMDELTDNENQTKTADEAGGESKASATNSTNQVKSGNSRRIKPGVTLTLTVDPSSDPDKLEKQLKLLRQYGMI